MLEPQSIALVAIASPIEAAALFRLDLLTAVEMVALCERWLQEDLDRGSAEVAWIAGQPSPTKAEIGPAFSKALTALAGALPDVDDAARTAVRLYVEAIADARVPAFEGMRAVDRDLDRLLSNSDKPLIDNPELQREPGVRYCGDPLGLQSLYTWYRELQDAEDGSRLFYYNDLPREAQLAKLHEELRGAAIRMAARLRSAQAV